MEIELKENERIDDLEFKGLKIIQNKNGFCFGMDAVLLSDFAKEIKNNSNVIDLGTGTGILPILLSGKTNNCLFTGVEIQKDVADMANRSVRLNKLDDKVKIENIDILKLKNFYERKSFDVIVTNPPYKKVDTGIRNNEERKNISKNEITASLEEFISISSYLLKDYGEFYMVNRPNRLVDIFNIMRKEKIEPKKIKMISSNENKKPNLILIKGVKNGKPFLEVEKDLIVYKKDGSYTDEILKIYNKND